MSASMARRTRSAVLGLTLAEPLMVRDTVAVETRALRATAVIFIGFVEARTRVAGAATPGIVSQSVRGEGGGWQPGSAMAAERQRSAKWHGAARYGRRAGADGVCGAAADGGCGDLGSGGAECRVTGCGRGCVSPGVRARCMRGDTAGGGAGVSRGDPADAGDGGGAPGSGAGAGRGRDG